MSDRAQALLTVLLLALCLLIAAFALLPRTLSREVDISFEAPEISVAVDGAVVAPGIYRLPFRSRVSEALELAGGVTAQAESSLVNLARPLGPGDRIHVPNKMTAQQTRRLSLNRASAQELELLPGVGPVTARRIIEGRPYVQLGDLLRVKGIGEKTLERLGPFVRL